MGALARLFVGVDLSTEARHALVAQLDAAIGGALPGTVVPPPNWHLTLRFLGDVDPVGYDRLLMELAGADLGPAFEVALDGLGAFPRTARATVLWTGVSDGSDPLNRLAGRVEKACVGAGFGPEERPFHAHLTLSR
ncbi:MAG: RNA 2',3'-cyclic phosphodiesterase, partial [Acidimicrobiia bacterium]|nr:RNA 2',3'-cyclic phosphodiesterase [Acidimicrobiia bacterium]